MQIDTCELDAGALQPRSKVIKEYLVQLHRRCGDDDVAQLAAGVPIATTQQRTGLESVQRTLPCEVERAHETWLRFRLSEGRNRQIRKMVEHLGFTVECLRRVRFDQVQLGDDLKPGQLRPLADFEVRALVQNHAHATAKAAPNPPNKRRGAQNTPPRKRANARQQPPKPRASPATGRRPEQPPRNSKEAAS